MTQRKVLSKHLPRMAEKPREIQFFSWDSNQVPSKYIRHVCAQWTCSVCYR